MWNWLWKLFGFKPKQLPAVVVVETLPVSTDEPSEVPFNPSQLPWHEMKPSLYQSLAKARQEALDPVLPESMKAAVDAGVNIVLPDVFKKHLMSKEDLILIGKSEVSSAVSSTSGTIIQEKKISDEDWNTIKCFIIKRLNDEGIKAEASSSGSFVMCHCADILKAIKDTQVLIEVSDSERVMHSVGIYR